MGRVRLLAQRDDVGGGLMKFLFGQFYLAGERMKVADGSTRLYDLDNPKVTIRRGVLGAFYLDLSVDNRSIRVRRVQ